MLITRWRHSISGMLRNGPMMSDSSGVSSP